MLLLVSPIPQRYNLKAIHNPKRRIILNFVGVTNTSKIQSESNSQLGEDEAQTISRCHQYLKDTIWKQFTTIFSSEFVMTAVSPIPQRYNLKAIHNTGKVIGTFAEVSPIPQRYNLKAIHNELNSVNLSDFGVTNTSKIQSESNSQLPGLFTNTISGCHQYLKDTIWKQFTTTFILTVFMIRCHQYLKDTIWKQFTTFRP